VPPRDPEALAGAILDLAGDPARRAALGAKGRERVVQFSADATAERTREAYLRVLRR